MSSSISTSTFWANYLQALASATGSSNPNNLLMLGVNTPAGLNISSLRAPAVSQAEANSVLYTYGNNLPAWSLLYAPGEVQTYSQFLEFVSSIKNQQDPVVVAALSTLGKVQQEIANQQSGSGVMSMSTGDGTEIVPNFISSPLGSNTGGFSNWLDTAILGVASKQPPQVSVTYNASSIGANLSNYTFYSASGTVLPFALWYTTSSGSSSQAQLSVSAQSITVSLQATTVVNVAPDPYWFTSTLLADFDSEADFMPGTPFSMNPIGGPSGLFNVLPTQLLVGFQPTISATFSQADWQTAMSQWSTASGGAIGIGPFFAGSYNSQSGNTQQANFNSNTYTITIQDTSTTPKLLAMMASTPDYTPSNTTSTKRR